MRPEITMRKITLLDGEYRLVRVHTILSEAGRSTRGIASELVSMYHTYHMYHVRHGGRHDAIGGACTKRFTLTKANGGMSSSSSSSLPILGALGLLVLLAPVARGLFENHSGHDNTRTATTYLKDDDLTNRIQLVRQLPKPDAS